MQPKTPQNMSTSDKSRWAEMLHHNRLSATETRRISENYGDAFGEADAYSIQAQGIELRKADGEKVIGYKMGLTSQAKREQMGLHSPVYGVLTDRMQIPNQQNLSLKGSIHPKIEPEIAFITSREIRDSISFQDALSYCSGVCAAMEILDSRYIGFKYFSLPDVIADNSSSFLFVLDDEIRNPENINLAELTLTLSASGGKSPPVSHTAISSEISGHPLQSLVQLSELLSAHGKALPAGSIVLAGAATAAIPLEPGLRVELKVSGLGSVQISVSE